MPALFFDTADTLYHSDAFQQAQSDRPIQQLAEHLDVRFPEAKALFEAKKNELSVILPHVTKVDVLMAFGISRIEMQKGLAAMDARDYLEPDQKLTALLTRLRKRYELGIITNILHEFMQNILAALAVDLGQFSYIVSVDNTTRSKPDPEPFKKALELYGQPNETCIYVGDSLSKDIIPAKAAGMKTIWVNTDGKPDPEAVSDAIITSIYDIEQVLRTL